MFAAAFAVRRKDGVPPPFWLQIAAFALVPGVMVGWTIENVLVEAFDVVSWIRTLAFAAIAVAAPVVAVAAYVSGRGLPRFAGLLGLSDTRNDMLTWALGIVLIALVLLALVAALGLVFDPRYRDVPFAPLTTAVVPLLVVSFAASRAQGPRALAESVAAGVLVLCAGYIVLNEGLANWQAVWFCAALVGLAVILARARDAPG
jgi:glucan 1,3-beta-glucosidase